MTSDQPSEIASLYHYEPFVPKYLEDTLVRDRVHFSNPQNFNDPWDCRPVYDAADLNEPGNRAKWIRFLQCRVDEAPLERREVLMSLNAPWKENEVFLSETIAGITTATWENNVERWRIYCLTSRPASLLMWSHYGDKHRGICLEFDASKSPVKDARKVTYKDSPQLIGPSMLNDGPAMLEVVLTSKSHAWIYEDEYRVLARNKKSDPTFTNTTEDDYLPLPPGAITAVIMGCNADYGAIENLVKKFAPSLPVKRAVRLTSTYGFNIE